MQKNTVIGFVLIGAILIGFSWYNSWSYKKQAKELALKDSLARVEALANPRIADSIRVADSIKNSMYAGQAKDTSAIASALKDSTVAAANRAEGPVYTDTLLERASKGAEELCTLENNKLKIDFSTKGAQVYKVLVKKYVTYDSAALYLVKEKYSHMSLVFFADQRINTENFNFTKTAQSDTSVTFRLNFRDGAYLDYVYTLPHDSYLLGYKIIAHGMNKIVPRNESQLELDWNLKVSRFERGYDNEKNYSTVNYKFPNDKSVEDLGMRKGDSDKKIPTRVQWFAFHQQFFSAIMMADNSFASGNLAYKFFPKEDPQKSLFDCSAHMQLEYAGGEDVTIPLHIYFGPNLYKELKSYGYGFEKVIFLGKNIIGWINRVVIINFFDFLRRFISSYGIIILIMTILLKLVLYPLTFKSYMSSAKMRVLKPEIDKINKKYPRKEDAMKKQQETMALYSKTGVSMMGGCLPMLLQIPILFAMFRFFPVSFELRQHSFLWASDLSGYDSIWNFGTNIPMYGNHVSLFALLMAVSMYFYSKMNMDQMPDSGQMPGMKGMQLYFMPIFMLVLCNNFSAGLSYYYMLTNVLTILQTWIIRKYFVDEKKLYEQLKAKAASSKTAKKSKFRERLDQMIKDQEKTQREQTKRR